MLSPLSPLAPLTSIDASTIGDIASAATSAASSAAGDAVSAGSQFFFGVKLSNLIIILLGLLLIAAGIFSFDKTRELVMPAVKDLAKGSGYFA